jgi:radical SAM protein
VVLLKSTSSAMIRTAPQKQEPRQPSPSKIGDGPLLVFYEVTQACDLVCDHCRACAQAGPAPGELSTQQSLRLINQLTEFPAPPLLVLTGGDPFNRADVFDLVEHAVGRRLNVSITPSATQLVTRRALRRLRCAGISRLGISIDGADARTHDAKRGVAGSFYRSLEILADAREEGIPTQVNTTLTPENVGQIDHIADLLARQQVVMWSVFFLVPVGRASNAPRLSADQCEAAFERLWHQSQIQSYAIKTTEAPHYRRFMIQRRGPKKNRRAGASESDYVPLGVNDGKGVMFVSHTGEIYPSGFMPICCGKYPAMHVARIYQNSPVLRALRDADRLEGKCRVCEFRHVCGGSRARAYAVTGNPFAEEPDCAYVPEALAIT